MTKQTIKEIFFNTSRPLVFGHKGCGGDVPENTIMSFDKGVKDGADVLEMDLRMTKDGTIVISHDAFLEGQTNGKGWIRDLTLAELKKLDAGYKFSPDDGKTFPFRGAGCAIPTLEEVFQRYPGIRMNIDLKSRNPLMAKKVVDLLIKYNRADITITGSFWHNNVARLRQEMKTRGVHDITCASSDEVTDDIMAANANVPPIKSPLIVFEVPVELGDVKVITPEFIKRAHDKGRVVIPWTINDEKEMEQLFKMGVDGIVTDKPALAKKVIEKLAQSRP
jgi:glycerophosphoryl diester phosphodiesterase